MEELLIKCKNKEIDSLQITRAVTDKYWGVSGKGLNNLHAKLGR